MQIDLSKLRLAIINDGRLYDQIAAAGGIATSEISRIMGYDRCIIPRRTFHGLHTALGKPAEMFVATPETKIIATLGRSR